MRILAVLRAPSENTAHPLRATASQDEGRRGFRAGKGSEDGNFRSMKRGDLECATRGENMSGNAHVRAHCRALIAVVIRYAALRHRPLFSFEINMSPVSVTVQ